MIPCPDCGLLASDHNGLLAYLFRAVVHVLRHDKQHSLDHGMRVFIFIRLAYFAISFKPSRSLGRANVNLPVCRFSWVIPPRASRNCLSRIGTIPREQSNPNRSTLFTAAFCLQQNWRRGGDRCGGGDDVSRYLRKQLVQGRLRPVRQRGPLLLLSASARGEA